jgi:hypothetical protein
LAEHLPAQAASNSVETTKLTHARGFVKWPVCAFPALLTIQQRPVKAQ